VETLARKKYHVFATMRAVEGRNAKTARDLRTLAESESHQLDVLELDVTDNASVERAEPKFLARLFNLAEARKSCTGHSVRFCSIMAP
jgi:hypothetical protein